MARGSRRSPSSCGRTHRVGAVGADHDPARAPRRRARPGRRAPRPGAPGAARSTAPAATARSTRRASKTARGTTCTSRRIGPATRASPRASSRSRSGVQPSTDVGGADLGERVEHVRRDAVAAALVAREVGAVEQQHPQRRVRRAAHPAPRRRRPGRRRPRPGPRLLGRHRLTTSSVASTSAIPTAAANGAPATPAQHDDGRAGRRRARPTAAAEDGDAAPSRTTAEPRRARPPPRPASRRGAEPVRQATHAGGRVVVEVGQHVEEVRTHAQQAAGQRQPQRRRSGVVAGQRRRTRAAARTPRRTAPRPDRRLQPQVVGPSGGDADQVHEPGQQPAGQGEADAQHDRDRARRPWRHAGPPSPVASGLSRRPDRTVSREVDQVVAPADRQLAAEHRGGHQQHPRTRTSPGLSRAARPARSRRAPARGEPTRPGPAMFSPSSRPPARVVAPPGRAVRRLRA